MPFFTPRHSLFPTDLFQLLNEPFPDPHTHTRRGFSPNFDVHETDSSFVLEGEVPGLSNKDNITLEFSDDKTLLVSGKIERSVQRYSDDQGRIQTIEGGEEPKKLTEGGEGKGKGKKREVGLGEEEERDEGRPKYWVSERSVGEFSRSFSFPSQVDVERVKASLEHGILKVVVPKMEKRQGKRITID